MDRIFRVSTVLVLAGLTLAGSGAAKAAPVYGSQAFADTGSPALVGGTGDINDATGFQFGNLITTTSQTDGFKTAVPPLAFMPSTVFTPSNPGTFSIGSASSAFGLFTASTATLSSSSPTSQSYILTGLYTPGTAFGTGNVPQFAMFAVSFTQAGGPGSAISDSATLITLAVPEPASVAMLGMAVVGLGGVATSRRRQPV